ncbi:MAG: hypothetical protein M3167_13720 [Acidobacteriota bacterium]|nr:hypothetical protein [Acidobacteriota bacterium]
MSANPDFRDLFAAFNAAQVRYLLVGGYALAFHGRPRFTKDLDVWLEPGVQNAARAYAALGAFGAPLNQLNVNDLERPGLIFQIGLAPNRIDVLTAIDGVTFENAWPDRQETRYSDQLVPVISRKHLIVNKRSTGRPQDVLDADELEKG